MKRLINCPKCHQNMAILRTDFFPNRNSYQKSYCVYCFNCKETTYHYDNEESAIKAWNNLSIKSFMDDIEDHMVENSFDSIVVIHDFDDKEIFACNFPRGDYCTTKELFMGLVNEMCSVNEKFTQKPMFTKEEIISWIKGE